MGGGIEQPRYVIAASVIESTSTVGFWEAVVHDD